VNQERALKEIQTAKTENRRADLRGADLTGADLSRAYLRGAKNIIVSSGLHGWIISMVNGDGGVKIYVGCHAGKTITEMREHWENHPEPQRREVCIPILNGLEQTAIGLGWIKAEEAAV